MHADEAAEDLLASLQKYTNVGIWLCQSQAKTSPLRTTAPPVRTKSSSKSDLLPEENLWLDLIDVTVQITRKLSASLSDLQGDSVFWH